MSNADRMYLVLNESFLPPKEFNGKRLTFGPATVTTQFDRDTVVTVTGIPGRGYYGDVDLYYNRMDLTAEVGSFSFRSTEQHTRETVAQALARRYQLDIDPDDFEPFTVPVLEEGQSTDITLTVKADSIQWKGSIPVHLEYGQSWLDDMVGKTTLDAFSHPNSTNRQSARLFTWGVDFSGIQAALKPQLNGDYTDWNAVATLSALLGIPAWVRGKVVDRATVDVPDSNPRFERVVIQQSVTSGVMVGPLYFHYNPV